MNDDPTREQPATSRDVAEFTEIRKGGVAHNQVVPGVWLTGSVQQPQVVYQPDAPLATQSSPVVPATGSQSGS